MQLRKGRLSLASCHKTRHFKRARYNQVLKESLYLHRTKIFRYWSKICIPIMTENIPLFNENIPNLCHPWNVYYIVLFVTYLYYKSHNQNYTNKRFEVTVSLDIVCSKTFTVQVLESSTSNRLWKLVVM